MKKKNFLRNFSATALAMCCLSSAIAFTSYASFEENNEENLGNIAWLFDEEEKEAVDLPSSASSSEGPWIELSVPFETTAKFPIEGEDGNVTFVGDNSCTVIFRANNVRDSSVIVTGAIENNNGIVFVPKKFDSVVGNMTVTGISSDAKFPDTKILAYPRTFESDENAINMIAITKNNPGIGFAPYDWKSEEDED